MRCPKCQYDNPDGTLYCEECDHRMDRPYRKVRETTVIPPLHGALFAVACGAVALLLIWQKQVWYMPVILGAAGLVMGSYSLSVIIKTLPDNREILMMMAAAGMLLSVIGLIYGMTLYT